MCAKTSRAPYTFAETALFPALRGPLGAITHYLLARPILYFPDIALELPSPDASVSMWLEANPSQRLARVWCSCPDSKGGRLCRHLLGIESLDVDFDLVIDPELDESEWEALTEAIEDAISSTRLEEVDGFLDDTANHLARLFGRTLEVESTYDPSNAEPRESKEALRHWRSIEMGEAKDELKAGRAEALGECLELVRGYKGAPSSGRQTKAGWPPESHWPGRTSQELKESAQELLRFCEKEALVRAEAEAVEDANAEPPRRADGSPSDAQIEAIAYGCVALLFLALLGFAITVLS